MVNPNTVQYGIYVHRPRGRLDYAKLELYCICARNELLAPGMRECILGFVSLFVIACFGGFVTTLCKVLQKINILILIL